MRERLFLSFLLTLLLLGFASSDQEKHPWGFENPNTYPPHAEHCYPQKCPPDNIHIAIINTTSMAISWQTLYQPGQILVEYGLNSSLGLNATGTTFSYQKSQKYNDSVWFNNDVILANLIPGRLYYYKVGSPNQDYSPVYTFNTPPDSNDSYPSVNSTILFYGDMGISKSQELVERLAELYEHIEPAEPPQLFDFILHCGDFSYANDYPADMYEDIWNAWFGTVEKIMTIRPYMVSPGNHEYNCSHPECYPQTGNFTAYNARFRMPSSESGGSNGTARNMWYSFDYANVHYVVINTETNYPNAPEGADLFPGQNQLEWLKFDLAMANKNRHLRPWLIVTGHRPIYSSSNSFWNTTTQTPTSVPQNLQTVLEQIFYDNAIDFYLSGHVHAYERSYPTFNNTVVSTSYENPQAPVYITSGSAGNTEGLTNHWADPQPSWSVVRNGVNYGYGILEFFDDMNSQLHTARWSFVAAENSTLADTFTLTKAFAQ